MANEPIRAGAEGPQELGALCRYIEMGYRLVCTVEDATITVTVIAGIRPQIGGTRLKIGGDAHFQTGTLYLAEFMDCVNKKGLPQIVWVT